MTDQSTHASYASAISQPSTSQKSGNVSDNGRGTQRSHSSSESSAENRGRPSRRGERANRSRHQQRLRSPGSATNARTSTTETRQSVRTTHRHISHPLSAQPMLGKTASTVSTHKPARLPPSSATEERVYGSKTPPPHPTGHKSTTATTRRRDGSHLASSTDQPPSASPPAPTRNTAVSTPSDKNLQVSRGKSTASVHLNQSLQASQGPSTAWAHLNKDLQVSQGESTASVHLNQHAAPAAVPGRLPLLRVICPGSLHVVSPPGDDCTRNSSRSTTMFAGTPRRRRYVPSDMLSPDTPVSRAGSGDDSDQDGYLTPLTSPEASPTKGRFVSRLLSRQLDGADSGVEDPFEEPGSVAKNLSATHERRKGRSSQSENSNHITHGSDHAMTEVDAKPDTCNDGLPADLDDEFTPATTPSLIKDPLALPFPQRAPSTPSRHPSSLLHNCEHRATPRQRRLMMGGIGSPDRFIPGRCATPTKEAFLLTDARKYKQPDYNVNPFSPTIRPSVRMAEQHATVRTPAPPVRAVGNAMTRVREARQPITRPGAQSGVWSVGGIPVTEGIPSTTNGRGGRVTSGTSAPHYAAEFYRRRSQTDEQVTHSRRLAHAMDLNQSGRMLEQSAPLTSQTLGDPQSPKRVVWNDGKWESPIQSSLSKAKSRRSKDIPIIPYRVLDAPALRDDYYCSLLAYSPTLQCLAVGLGPHVYLWSEDRGKTGTSLPDSLTVPRGTSHVTSLSFSSTGGGNAILAIGRGDGRITLWSPLDRDPRFDSEQPSPVSHVCFRPTTHKRRSIRDSNITVDTEELLVGDEVGNVYLYSIEWPNQTQRELFDWHGSMTLLARISCHSQQICGIAWSPDGELFATGGNDNNLYLFETKKILRRPRQTTPGSAVHVRNGNAQPHLPGQKDVLAILLGQQKHTFTLNAACKALAFAPWQPSLLVAGGGSNDRCMHFFHALSGATLATIDCYAQVTSLVFNPRKREIAATFGFAQPEHPYRIAVFSWPSCRMVVGVPWWGEERALWAVGVPGPGVGRGNGGSLVVATSDASIKFHEVWSEGAGEGVEGRVLGSQILDEVLAGEGREVIR